MNGFRAGISAAFCVLLVGVCAFADDLRLPDSLRDTVVQPTNGLLQQAAAGASGGSGAEFREDDPLRAAVRNAFTKIHSQIGDPNTLEPATQDWVQLLSDRASLVLADFILHPTAGSRLTLDPRGLTLSTRSLDPLTRGLGAQFDRATPLGTSLTLPTLADAGYAALAGPFHIERKDLAKLDGAIIVGGGAALVGILGSNGLGFSGTEPLVKAKGDKGFGLSIDEAVSHFGLAFDPTVRAGTTLTYKIDPRHALDVHFDVANFSRALHPKYEGGMGVQLGDTHVGLGGGVASYQLDPAHHVTDISGIIGLNRIGFGLHHGEIDGSDGRVVHDEAALSDSWQFKNGSLLASLTASHVIDTTKALLVDDHGVMVRMIGTTGLGQRFAANGQASLGLVSDVSHCLFPVGELSFQLTDRYTQISGMLSALYDPRNGDTRAQLTVAGPLPVAGVSDRRYAEQISSRLSMSQDRLAGLEDELLAVPGERLLASDDANVSALRRQIAQERHDMAPDLRQLRWLARRESVATQAQRDVAKRSAARLRTLVREFDRRESELHELPGAAAYDPSDPRAVVGRARLEQARELLRQGLDDNTAIGYRDPDLANMILERARDVTGS